MMNRREFLASSAAGLLGAETTASKPNIIFLLADDLGYGDLSCYGQKRFSTPNLDRIAAEGTRFTQAYAGSTVCAPSRCCLMTGLHSGRATVRGNKKPEVGLRPEETTVASLLQKAGYETALFGKWGLGGPATGSVPNTRGYDHFYGYLNQLHAHNYYPSHLWDNQNEAFLTENWFNQRKQYSPDLIHRRTLDFLEQDRAKPFFLYLAYTIPHANNELGRYQGNGMEIPDNAPFSGRDWPETEKNFAAMVTRLDREAGDILDALKRKGLDSNTLFIFSSDNGPHREGGHDPEFFNSNGPLRGIKRDLYDGGIRVPFFARWPGRVPAGRTSDQVFAFWDLLPTAAELAGASAPPGIDGASVLPALLGNRQTSHEYLYWEFHEGGFKQAVRMDEWKGVRLSADGPVELYNVVEDVGEMKDLAAANPQVVKKIGQIMTHARTESTLFPVQKS
ncbi:MAG TPA: arylsulfatase [Bryobacteraceae bacterium]|nr:arylsulfatase [Bryobacteraceae bacterium]